MYCTSHTAYTSYLVADEAIIAKLANAFRMSPTLVVDMIEAVVGNQGPEDGAQKKCWLTDGGLNSLRLKFSDVIENQYAPGHVRILGIIDVIHLNKHGRYPQGPDEERRRERRMVATGIKAKDACASDMRLLAVLLKLYGTEGEGKVDLWTFYTCYASWAGKWWWVVGGIFLRI